MERISPNCEACAQGVGLPFEFTMAFQPIIDTQHNQVFAYEALARGMNDEPARFILDQVTADNRYLFDQSCRVKAIQKASELGIDCYLSINFLPNAVYNPEHCLRTTLQAAKRYGFPKEQLILEITEGERIDDHAHVLNIIKEYKRQGLRTAIDDFGAGYAGLNLLAEFQPDLLKIDMNLVRGVHRDRTRQAIVRGIVEVCDELLIPIIAEGIEEAAEYETLSQYGIQLFQGYYFARPGYQRSALAHLSY